MSAALEISRSDWIALPATRREELNRPAAEALLRGEAIEWWDGETWQQGRQTDLAFAHRPKPRPMECWLSVWSNGSVSFDTSREDALARAAGRTGLDECPRVSRVAIHMVEASDAT